MASINHRAGKSTREMAQRRRKAWIIAGIVGLTITIFIFLLVQNASALGIGGLGVLAMVVLAKWFASYSEKTMNTLEKAERRAIRGAKAEEKIEELLSQLSDDFVVLHDVESPYGNIDHIVISKISGVYLLETKAHGGEVSVNQGQLLVNGKSPEKDFIAQALRNTYWLKEQIAQVTEESPWITPVVVFTNAFVPPLKPIKGVYVLNKKYLLPLLQRTPKTPGVFLKIWENRQNIVNRLMGK